MCVDATQRGLAAVIQSLVRESKNAASLRADAVVVQQKQVDKAVKRIQAKAHERHQEVLRWLRESELLLQDVEELGSVEDFLRRTEAKMRSLAMELDHLHA
eukprot:CAMPEP_0118976672 /NCGR_PEP_ID=MMETSP1173-20130426/19409_1 /TAXON_ID=1034831 /ORGANISM="Rhizochromulina marina cf, Strain CCMP1243" /LENGTH=100 /DNA_ID=CAMNT_0006926723 /DNA_START=178 /DNA_END=477 /DNA_ORIENTATION=+